jgi:restriction system protein
MKIGTNSRVRPHKHEDRDLNKAQGIWIGSESEYEAFASYFWRQEVGLVVYLRQAWRDHIKLIETCVAEYTSRPDNLDDGARRAWATAWEEYRAALSTGAGRLSAHLPAARDALAACDIALEKLIRKSTRLLAEEYEVGSQVDTPQPLAPLSGSLRAADRMDVEIKAAIQEVESSLKLACALGTRRNAFRDSEVSVSLNTIARMNPYDFEFHIADLLERDGMSIEQRGGGKDDHGMDVLALRKGEDRWVVQVKLRGDRSTKISPKDVHAFNGTARPEHKADVALFVTNVQFSAAAKEFATRHRLALIDRDRLHRWSALGDPIETLIPDFCS